MVYTILPDGSILPLKTQEDIAIAREIACDELGKHNWDNE